jgi:hypothetical protein
LELAIKECERYTGHKKEADLCVEVENYFARNPNGISKHLKSKMYRKLGQWIKMKEDRLTPQTLKLIDYLYNKSINLQPKNHKTWHRYALLNLEAAK